MLNSLNSANTFGISLAIPNTRLQRQDLLDFENTFDNQLIKKLQNTNINIKLFKFSQRIKA